MGRWRDAIYREAPPALGILAGGRRLGAAGCMDPDGMGPGVAHEQTNAAVPWVPQEISRMP